MLQGKNVNLRLMEREDVDFIVQLRNDLDSNVYVSVKQMSKAEIMKEFDNPGPLALMTERTRFIIEKKDGTKIGYMMHWVVQPSRLVEIGYFMIPKERGCSNNSGLPVSLQGHCADSGRN